MKDKIKKIIAILLLFSFLFVGCGNSMKLDIPTKIGHKTVKIGTYGLINKDDNMNPSVKYRPIIGNIVWSVILCETIIVPIYFIGFSIYEPIGLKKPIRLKTGNKIKGEIY